LKRPAFLGRSTTLPILVALWIIVAGGVAILAPGAISAYTATTILQFATILALAALGQSLVVLAGGTGIDLSVGGITSLTAVTVMLALQAGMPSWLLPLAAILCGLGLGAINGVLVTRLGLLPLIATLGSFYTYAGLALAVTGGAAQDGVPAWLVAWGRGQIGPIPLPFLTTALPGFILAGLLLGWTSWGRWIYAMGYNESAARLSGIKVDRTRLLLYAVSGGCCGIAALVSLAWLGSARPDIGDNLELTSLTAAMLGGIGIFGGIGGVGGVLAAVILLVTLQTGLLQLNVNSIWQVGIVGLLLILVLLTDRLSAGPRRFARGARGAVARQTTTHAGSHRR
jgi:ribose/xylose/arabinose/galactoside ABC-type transport system permease subunit